MTAYAYVIVGLVSVMKYKAALSCEAQKSIMYRKYWVYSTYISWTVQYEFTNIFSFIVWSIPALSE